MVLLVQGDADGYLNVWSLICETLLVRMRICVDAAIHYVRYCRDHLVCTTETGRVVFVKLELL
jgi:hypothetical protein